MDALDAFMAGLAVVTLGFLVWSVAKAWREWLVVIVFALLIWAIGAATIAGLSHLFPPDAPIPPAEVVRG